MKRIIVMLAFLLSACGAELNGTYSDPLGVTSYTFQSNGKVLRSAIGMEVEQDYALEGNKIKIYANDETMVLTLNEDGSITGPLGIPFKKEGGVDGK